MPQPFINAVMTNAGANILTRSQAGEGPVVFTRIATGSGSYNDTEKNIATLQTMTKLKNEKNSYAPSSVKQISEFSVKITALISNMDPITKQAIITEAYNINEMGLYAKIDGDSTDVLYSITVTSGSKGDLMPPYSGENPAQITQGWETAVSNTAEISMKISNEAVALATDLEEVKSTVADSNKMIAANAVNILAIDVSLTLLQGAAVAGTSDNICVETFQDDSDFRIASGIYDRENRRLYA